MAGNYGDAAAQLGIDGQVAKLQQSTFGSTKPEIVALTSLTGAFGTPGNAIVDVTATPTQTTINNNFRAVEDKINAILAALKA